MGVSILVKTEGGEHVADVDGIAASVPLPIPSPEWTWLVRGREPEFPLLRGIDAYGNTCFNRLQRTQLMAELQALEDTGINDEGLSLIRALRVLIGIADARPHRYLWFIGD